MLARVLAAEIDLVKVVSVRIDTRRKAEPQLSKAEGSDRQYDVKDARVIA
jgi:hypothetical protein